MIDILTDAGDVFARVRTPSEAEMLLADLGPGYVVREGAVAAWKQQHIANLVRAEASRRMQEIVGARDAEHLMIMQMKAHEEAIELLDKLYANKAMTTAEMTRIAELRTLRSVFQEIRDASNALETDPPLDYREDKYWTLDGRVSTSEGWFTGIWGYITSKITGNK